MRVLGPGGTDISRWLRPAAIVLITLLLILLVRQRERRPIISSFEAPGQEAAPPAAVVPTVAPDTGRVPAATTDYLRLYTSRGSYDDAAAAKMAAPLDEALAYVQQRTGIQLSRPVNIVFDRRPEACGLDAAAYTGARTIMLYACPDIPTRRAVNVLAHEYVHQLAHDRYGAPHLEADLILSEGIATWGAGRYWLGRYDSFHDFVAGEYQDRLLPLNTDPHTGVSIDTLNQLYYQWASYVEWIIATHGREALDQLYTSGRARATGSANYQGVLQTGFDATEQQWRAWLHEPFTPSTPD